ncbi:MAG TPA: hypothetical protein PLR12_03870, partial [Clostridia bacterium]|nr:hypothetical protein [Clostridia bacterium]
MDRIKGPAEYSDSAHYPLLVTCSHPHYTQIGGNSKRGGTARGNMNTDTKRMSKRKEGMRIFDGSA